MQSLTTNLAPWVQCQCPCSRTYILDEMYYCIKCTKPVCRFCLTEEIESFYCRACFMTYSTNEAGTFKNKCNKYLSCPICLSIMTMLRSVTPQKTWLLYYNCMYCQFNTINVGIMAEESHVLLMKVIMYKGLYRKMPQ